MLDRARALAVYDRLVTGDAIDFMAGTPDSFDLVVAADVLAYVGDVPHFLQAACHALRVDGRLAASTESLDQEGQSEGYVLSPSGRYKHSRNYLANAIRHAGFVVDAMVESDMRQESDRMIKGGSSSRVNKDKKRGTIWCPFRSVARFPVSTYAE